MKERIKYLSLFFFLIGNTSIFAQQVGTIKGNIFLEASKEVVPFVHIYLKNTSKGSHTDALGNYTISDIAYGNYEIVVSGVGYENFSQSVSINQENVILPIFLKSSEKQLEEVSITAAQQEVGWTNSPVKTEVIQSRFLQKNRTSNLVEAIAHVNGIQEQVGCGVCGTNQLRINGLEGPYTMVLIDGSPIMGALSSVYGLNSIPTAFIDRLEITKGPNATFYGSEAVGGTINVITKDASKLPLFSLNIFGTSHAEKNIDAALAFKTKRYDVLLGSNYFHANRFIDKNQDNFSDVVFSQKISLWNKWSFKGKDGHKTLDISARYYYEDRAGGQKEFLQGNIRQLRGNNQLYGESIYTNRAEVIGTYYFPTKEKIYTNFSYISHQQNSFYGTTAYKAKQSIGFANVIWDKRLRLKHFATLGGSFRYQLYDDNTPATLQGTTKQIIPGIFIQDHLKFSPHFSTLFAFRTDYHKDHGFIYTPKMAVQWELNELTMLKLNTGTGFRVVNLFTEDHAALSGTREVVVAEALKPERSWNTTLNLNHNYSLGKNYGVLDFDIFYTYFYNRIIPDYQTNSNQIIYSNLKGNLISRGVAVTLNHNFSSVISLSLGATYQQVYQTYIVEEVLQEKKPLLFTPNLIGVFTASYKIDKWGISLDYTGKVLGKQYLPTYPAPFEQPAQAPWFTIQNLQLTKKWQENFSVYLGVKNLFDWTQPNPLIDAQNPFSPNFDTTCIYGPLQGRRYLLGMSLNF